MIKISSDVAGALILSSEKPLDFHVITLSLFVFKSNCAFHCL